jgi:MFS family permease
VTELPFDLLRCGRFLRVWLAGGIVGVLRWLETLAFGVFVLEVSGSPALVATMTFVRLAPMLVVGVPLGALADRVDRRRLLAVGLLLLTLATAALLLLALTGRLAVWQLAIGALLGGVFQAGEFPVRRTLVGEIVGPARTARAMGLESATSNATRMLGPPLGGLLLQLAGIEGVLLLSLLGYALATLIVWPLAPVAVAGRVAGPEPRAAIEGIRYARRHRVVLATLVVTVVFNLFGFAFMGLVPVVGDRVLGLSAFLIGVLMAAEGLGSLIGSLAVGSLAKPAHYLRLYVGGTALFLLMVLVFALSTSFALSLTSLVLAGLGLAGFAVMQSTLVFALAPSALRARLMGLLAVCIGTGPLGMLLIGGLAELTTAAGAILIFSGSGLVALAVCLALWPELWREPFVPPAAQSDGATSSREAIPSRPDVGAG